MIYLLCMRLCVPLRQSELRTHLQISYIQAAEPHPLDPLLKRVVWCTSVVRCLEFGGCPLFESTKHIATGIAVGTLTVVRYTVDVRYSLSEVSL